MNRAGITMFGIKARKLVANLVSLVRRKTLEIRFNSIANRKNLMAEKVMKFWIEKTPDKMYGKTLEERLNSIANRNNLMAEKAMEFWIEKGPDKMNGGFYSIINEDGTPQQDTKFIIQQIRYLWTCSMWYSKRDSSEKVEKICHDLYDFIISSFRNPQTGDFYFSVNSNGTFIENTDRLSYADAFIIYGLSEYADVFNNQESLQFALDVFQQINARAYDYANKGYDQTRDDRIFTPLGEKDTNTHLHILEAFARLYQVSQKEEVGAKLNELIDVFINKIIQNENYCSQYFLNDWTPYPNDNNSSYGHDLEAVWLLIEAAKTLNRNEESAFEKKVIDMGKRSALEGYDKLFGVYNNLGTITDKVVDGTKIWWVQFEAMEGLWNLYSHTRDTQYLSNIESILDWLENEQLNERTNEWYQKVDYYGNLGSNRNMADEWKTNYHALRGLVNTANWVNEFLKVNFLKIDVLKEGEGIVTIDPAMDSYSKGSLVTLYSEPLEGFRFSHWSGDVTGSSNTLEIEIQKDIFIQANFKAIEEKDFSEK